MPISPIFTIHQFREDLYKVVYFKRRSDPDAVFLKLPEEYDHSGVKLDNNFSRARSMVLQYALCNPWDFFFTGTIDRHKFDRFDLDTYYGRLSQWIRDKRKAYGAKFQVLLVPERHEDGAWHIHGLIHDLPPSVLCPFYCLPHLHGVRVPQKLIDGGFFNWPDYMERFGFCSLAPVCDPTATAFYISKYVSKDLSRRSEELGKHLYFHSRPLKKAVKASDIYYYSGDLERLCTNDYDFCKTGMVEDVDWTFPYAPDGADFSSDDLFPPPPPDPLEGFQPETVEPPPEVWKQLSFSL